MPDNLRPYVLRRWASGVCHVADVPPSSVVHSDAFNSSFFAVPLPVVTRCGATLRGRAGTVGGLAVLMREDTAIDCKTCRYLSPEPAFRPDFALMHDDRTDS